MPRVNRESGSTRASPSLDLTQMEEELSALIGRKVDLVERRAVEQSEDYIRGRQILATAEPVSLAR